MVISLGAASRAVMLSKMGNAALYPQPEVLKAKGYKIEETFTISDADLEAIPQGEELSE